MAKVKADLKAAGYNGEKVVLLVPTNSLAQKPLGDIAADMLQQAGMNVEYAGMDFGVMLQRQQYRVDDALVVSTTIAIFGMRPGDGFAEAVVVQVQQAGQHKAARFVEDLGGRRPVARYGSNPPALQQHPVIAQHFLRAIPAR